MIKRLIAWIETRIAIRKVRAARIPLDSKCPACGHTGVDLSVSYQFKDQKPKVGLTCRVCKNLWFREPIVNAEKWAPKLQENVEWREDPHKVRAYEEMKKRIS